MNFNESQYNFDYNCVYFLTSEEEENISLERNLAQESTVKSK